MQTQLLAQGISKGDSPPARSDPDDAASNSDTETSDVNKIIQTGTTVTIVMASMISIALGALMIVLEAFDNEQRRGLRSTGGDNQTTKVFMASSQVPGAAAPANVAGF